MKLGMTLRKIRHLPKKKNHVVPVESTALEVQRLARLAFALLAFG